MATWTTIADTTLEPGKPARSIDAIALRDNPIAIAEGAAGAPRIDGATSPAIRNGGIPDGELGAEKFQTGATERTWVLARTASASVGAVGTYAMLRNTSVGNTPGSTSSGSNLEYSSADNGTGANPSGTWMIMGDTASSNVATVWLRIS